MIEINATLLIQMVNFFIFLFLMNLFLYRPIRRLLAQRNALIEGQRQGIEQAEADATAAVEQFEMSLQNARAEGRQKVQELKDSGYQSEKEMLKGAGDEAAAHIQAVKQDIAASVQTARGQLRDQVRMFSVELAQKVLGRTI